MHQSCRGPRINQFFWVQQHIKGWTAIAQPLHAGPSAGRMDSKEKGMKKKDYYEVCAFPKPKDTKKKRPENGWKDKPNRVCEVCGEYGAERHEIFGGPNRRNSIEDGLQMDLCQYHHRLWHEDTSKKVSRWRDKCRQKAQRKYEQSMMENGYDDQQARMSFMRRYGFNLLGDPLKVKK